jgi:hypothetical protein
MNGWVRTALAAIAFVAIVAVAIAAAPLRGETKETSNEQLCSTVAWPMIPANCLEGGATRTVRPIGADVDAFDAEDDAEADEALADMQVRFDADFN